MHVRRAFVSLGLGEIAARLIAFGATVFVARMLGAGAYGVAAFAGAALLYFTTLGDLGVEAVGAAAVARAPSDVDRLVPSVLLARLAFATLLSAATATAGLLLPAQPEGALLAAFGAVLLVRALNARWVLVGLRHNDAAGVARVLGEGLSAALVLAFVREAGDLVLLPAIQLAGDGMTALVLFVALRRQGYSIPARWEPGVARAVLREASPLMMNAFLALLVFNLDLLLLRYFRDGDTVGRYAAAYTLVSFLSNLGLSFGYAVLPSAAQLDRDDAASGRLAGGALLAAVALMLPVAVGGWTTSGGLLAAVFGAPFATAALAMQVLLWSVPLAWCRFIAQMTVVARGGQRAVLGVTTVAAVCAVAGDLLLIPRYGMVGAAAVTVATEALRAAATLVLMARRGVALPRPAAFWRPVAATAAMATMLAWAGFPVLVAVPAGALVYVAALVVTGGVRRGADGRLGLRL